MLEMGDSLYVGIKSQLVSEGRYVDDHLTVEEMLQQALTDNNVYNVRMSPIRCGYVKAQVQPGGWLIMEAQLQSLSTDVSNAILIVSPECIAVFRDRSERYGVFDSHSRNARGLPYPDGTAIVLIFSHLSDLISHLHRLFEDRGSNASYEFVPVSFDPVDKSCERHGTETGFGEQLPESDVETSVVLQPETNAKTQESKSQTTSVVTQQHNNVEEAERMQEWICYSCDDHLRRGNLPTIAVANKLELAPIPLELVELNVLERQLIAKILPFAKIVALPKGQQRAVHSAVVCVPSEVEATVNCLPRPSSDAQLLQVKLKRRIKYKGHQYFYTVNMKNVLAALATLKDMYSEYKDVSIDQGATFNSLLDDLPCNEEQTQQDNGDASEQADQSQNPEKDELRPGLVLDSCMQPPDIAQEALSYGNGIFSVAPAQGNKPVGFFAIPKLEAMAFPVQFPTGQNTLDEFVTETHIATNSMSIQMRKGKPITSDGRKISSKMLQDKQEVEKLITNKDATRFMQPLRGTPAYWEKTLKDLNAMVRQLGKPTFFLTFSAAEMRWPEVIEAVKAQQGEQVDFSQLDWNAKCDILRSNPVTVMWLFEKRVDALMTDLILSPAQPIGEVEDYFYRVEFQARGSPHIHLLVWIKDAPEFGDLQDDSVVIKFIDQYITCQMPDPNADPELHKIVSEVQLHSRNHSKSCKKGNVMCRFGFPKLPMDKTILTYPTPDDDDDDDNDNNDQQQSAQKNRRKGKRGKRKSRALRLRQNEAKDKLQTLRNYISDPNVSFNNLSELLEKCNLTYEEYKKRVTAALCT
ncbi:hypothetical protein D5F01_LYC23957 [Larimichthys crocea]|uniref:Uncharacterized protein n=1 Tax=Larimichthys crocea TaxID=215358 RepID=A0A6G0HG37_LARCR|nr:hypothetical protein D5F01_LYC23957 [Larimichthys crocea]